MKTGSALVAFVVALAVAGCGSSSSGSGVAPSAYVKSFCTALQTFKQDVQSAENQAQASITGAKSLPEVKQKLQPFAAALVSAFDKLINSIKAAGSPAIADGKNLSNRYVSAFIQFRGAFAQAQTQYSHLPTDSPASFKAAVQQVSKQLKQNESQLKSNFQFKKNGQLHDAALKDPTCQAVKVTS